MGRRAGGQTDGRTDARTDARTHRRTHERTHAQTNGRMGPHSVGEAQSFAIVRAADAPPRIGGAARFHVMPIALAAAGALLAVRVRAPMRAHLFASVCSFVRMCVRAVRCGQCVLERGRASLAVYSMCVAQVHVQARVLHMDMCIDIDMCIVCV